MKKTDSGLSAGRCRSCRNDMPGKELRNIYAASFQIKISACPSGIVNL